MDHKLYKTPDPKQRTDISIPYKKSISDLLLAFDDSPNLKEGINKVVTVPAQNEIGFNVVACQAFFRELGHSAYVLLHDRKGLYQFRRAVFPRKSGLIGLLFDTEKTGIVGKCFNTGTREEKDEYDTELKKLSVNHITIDGWYHFTGKAENILEELQKKCALSLR